jgi:FtsK/SpoIIIE family
MTTRQDAIEGLLIELAAGKVTASQIQEAFRQSSVTQAEVEVAKTSIASRQPKKKPQPVEDFENVPSPPAHNSALAPDLLPVGDTIAAAIASIVGVSVAFIPDQSISSYAVHLLRFQPQQNGNLARIETDAAIAALRGAVSLPFGSACEVKPSGVIGMPGYIDVAIPRADRQQIFFSAQEVGVRNCGGNRPELILGRDLHGHPVELKSSIHLAVVGESGGGKSNFLHQIIAIHSLWNSPNHVRFAFCDLERRTFARFENYPWNFCPPLIEADQEKWADFTGSLMQEYNRRSRLFEECEDILTWNRQNPDRPEPIIFVCIEELGRLNTAFSRAEVDEFLIQLAERGRANGFYLLIAMQRPAADVAQGVIHPRVMTTLQTRIAFKCARQTAGLIDCPGAANLRGNGDGLALIDGSWVRFQAWNLGEDKQRIFDGLDRFARKKYGRACYEKPKPTIPAQSDPWDVEEEGPDPAPQVSDRDLAQYKMIQDLKQQGKSQQEIIRAVFPDAPKSKPINGNTLVSFNRRVTSLCARVEAACG